MNAKFRYCHSTETRFLQVGAMIGMEILQTIGRSKVFGRELPACGPAKTVDFSRRCRANHLPLPNSLITSDTTLSKLAPTRVASSSLSISERRSTTLFLNGRYAVSLPSEIHFHAVRFENG